MRSGQISCHIGVFVFDSFNNIFVLIFPTARGSSSAKHRNDQGCPRYQLTQCSCEKTVSSKAGRIRGSLLNCLTLSVKVTFQKVGKIRLNHQPELLSSGLANLFFTTDPNRAIFSPTGSDTRVHKSVFPNRAGHRENLAVLVVLYHSTNARVPCVLLRYADWQGT